MAESLAELHLRKAAEAAWERRWQFSSDMTGDGAVTISDVWQWWVWIFNTPGDAILLAIMMWWPSTGIFLELRPEMVSGVWAGFLSLLVWAIVVGPMLRS